MPTYHRKPEDVSFRIVSLENMELKQPVEFQTEGQEIPMPRESEVLEILHADGSSELIAGMDGRTVHYLLNRGEIILLNNCPRGRIWIRRADGTGPDYKCPADWKKRSDSGWFCCVGNTVGMELTGDKYANEVLSFVQG